MLLFWCFVAGLLLTIPTRGDIRISDEELLETFLEAQEKLLRDDEKARSSESRHPQIKIELKPEQRHALLLEMATRKLIDKMG